MALLFFGDNIAAFCVVFLVFVHCNLSAVAATTTSVTLGELKRDYLCVQEENTKFVINHHIEAVVQCKEEVKYKLRVRFEKVNLEDLWVAHEGKKKKKLLKSLPEGKMKNLQPLWVALYSCHSSLLGANGCAKEVDYSGEEGECEKKVCDISGEVVCAASEVRKIAENPDKCLVHFGLMSEYSECSDFGKAHVEEQFAVLRRKKDGGGGEEEGKKSEECFADLAGTEATTTTKPAIEEVTKGNGKMLSIETTHEGSTDSEATDDEQQLGTAKTGNKGTTKENEEPAGFFDCPVNWLGLALFFIEMIAIAVLGALFFLRKQDEEGEEERKKKWMDEMRKELAPPTKLSKTQDEGYEKVGGYGSFVEQEGESKSAASKKSSLLTAKEKTGSKTLSNTSGTA